MAAKHPTKKSSPEASVKTPVNLVVECIARRIETMAGYIRSIGDMLYDEYNQFGDDHTIAQGCEILLAHFASELEKMGKDLAAIAGEKGGAEC